MADSSEVNTEYLSKWVLNDESVYWEGKRIAEGGSLNDLREYVVTALRESPKESGGWHTSEAMSEADIETVDWDEIRECLVN